MNTLAAVQTLLHIAAELIGAARDGRLSLSDQEFEALVLRRLEQMRVAPHWRPKRPHERPQKEHR